MDPITGVVLGKKVMSEVKHSIWRTVSVICVLAVLFLIGLGVKRILYPLKPIPTTTQNAELIENKYYYPNKKVFGIGVNLFGMDIGLSKYDYPKEPIIKTEIKEIKK